MDVPLPLQTGNFAAVSAQGLRIPEALLRLGRQAVTEVERIARNGTLQMDLGCGGTAHYTLTDADGNGVPSAGDSLKIDYSHCTLAYLDGRFNGTLVIRLGTVDDAQHGALSGTIDLGAGLAPDDGTLGKWLGTMRFSRTATVLGEQLDVDATAADDLQRFYRLPRGVASIDQHEAYRHLHLSRSLQREIARIALSGSLVLASDLLGGRLDIAIDPTLGAYLQTWADTGSARITGAANSRITLVPDASASANLQGRLDADGDGVDDSTAPLAWLAITAGFLWSEQDGPSDGVLFSHNEPFLALLSQPEFNQNLGVDLSRPLRLQFGRPLDAGTVVHAQLEDHGATNEGQYGTTRDALSDLLPVVAAEVSLHGAVMLVQPSERLRDGHSYQLYLSSTGDFQNPQAVTLRSADGNALLRLDVLTSGFNTDDMLWAAVIGAGTRSVVMPGQAVALTSSLPLATSLPLQYQWTQLSGPTLALGSPDAANTTVQWADPLATGIGRAVLQLTVTDGIGRSSSAPVELQVANVDGAPTRLSFKSLAGEFIGAGQTRVYSPQTGSFTTDTTFGFLTVWYADLQPGTNWTLQLRAPGGGVPTVGSYANAVDIADLQDVAPEMNFSGSGRYCGVTGHFEVLELQLDGNGVVQRLAADFEQTCTQTNQPSPMHGSIRINSTVPVQP